MIPILAIAVSLFAPLQISPSPPAVTSSSSALEATTVSASSLASARATPQQCARWFIVDKQLFRKYCL